MAFDILQDVRQVGAGGELSAAQEAVVASLNSLGVGGANDFVQKTGATTFANVTSSSGVLDATYVTLSTNSSLTVERVLTGTANQITLTDNGAGSTVVLSLPQSIATTSDVSFGSLALSTTLDVTGLASFASGLKITKLGSNPSAASSNGKVFTKTVSSVVELFYLDDAGTATQITSNGAIGDGELFAPDDAYLSVGNTAATPDAIFGWNTAQTVDGLYLGLSAAQNTFIIAEAADKAFDFAHGAATNPTVFVHSAAQNTTQWISLAHNQTDGVITTGAGDLLLQPSTGLVGIGAITPTNDLSFAGNAAKKIWMERTTTGNSAGFNLTIEAGGAVSSGANKAGGDLLLSSGTSTGSGTSNITFNTFPGSAGAAADNTVAERARITGAGLVLVNGTTAYGTSSQRLEVNSSAVSGGVAINSWTSTAAQAPSLLFQRSKSATVGTMTTVATQDTLGIIEFVGSDGTNFRQAALIKGEVDASVTGGGAADMPGRLVFYTSADGSATPTSRLTLDRNGVFKPSTNDGVPLGNSSNTFSDLFLASGGTVDFNSDIVLTHATDILAHSGGTFIFGATAITTAYGRLSQAVEINATAIDGGLALNTWSAADAGAILDFNNSNSDTIGTHTIVASGDTLGVIAFRGSNGTIFQAAAEIRGMSDGTPGAGTDMPGRLTFSTTPDGSATLAERMRIDNAGKIVIGSTSTALGPVSMQTTASGSTTVLALNQNVAAATGAGPSLVFYGNADAATAVQMGYIASSWTAANTSNTYMSFFTRTTSVVTEKMNIQATGTVNILNDVNIGYDGASFTNVGGLSVFAADNSGGATIIRINATQANITGADVYTNFSSLTGVEANVVGTGVAGVIAYNTFTGSHWSQSESIEKKEIKLMSQTTGKEKDAYSSDLEPGTVLVSTDEMCYWEGEGSSNTLPKTSVSTKKEDKAVYGVYGGHDADGDIIVLALGTGVVLVTDEGGEIEIGDMLCTSSTPGYAMKYNGSDLAVVGFKARQSMKEGKGKIACSIMAG